MPDNPFSAAYIATAVQQAIQQEVLPPDKHFAVVGLVTASGDIQGKAVMRFGEHWTVVGDIDLHKTTVSGGAQVIASW